MTNPMKPRRHWRAALTARQVETVRARRAEGTSQAALAKQFKVSQATISNLLARKTYRSV